MNTQSVTPAGTHPHARPIHLVIVTEDDEIRDVFAFVTHAHALACRDTLVRDRWDECMNGEPIPADLDAAFERFEDEACYSHGVFIRLMNAEIVP